MKKIDFKTFLMILLSVLMAIGGLFTGKIFNVNKRGEDSPIKPETWALTDGLGRTAPQRGEVREKNRKKFVGLFYWTWHTEQGAGRQARNVTEILAEHPEALRDYSSPVWGGLYSGYPHFWNEPIYGYYYDTDAYVLRKQAELIADAGVDVIFFDCTNGTALWKSSYEKLFEVFEQAKKDGVNVPQIAFMLPFFNRDDMHADLVTLYNDIYSKGSYEDLWFIWEGKPLIMCKPDCLDVREKADRELYEFFTFRANEAGYFAADTTPTQRHWGWCSDYPQTRFGKSVFGTEQICVSVAQNAADGALVAMNAEGNVQGRAFSKGDYSYSYEHAGKTVTASSDMEDALKYGINFQQQWDYAIEQDPEFIFVTGWNEWIAGRFDEWMGTENAFPDECNDEFSRDCEPSKGILKDHYYCQLVENIRRYKGISAKTEEKDGVKTYYHYEGSTPVRDAEGWGGLRYTYDTMRNDFIKAEVSDGSGHVNMTIYTKDPITPRGGKGWMRVFIDTDPTDCLPNWEGFEYVINREGADENTVTIERSKGGWDFETVGRAEYSVSGGRMTIKIPVSALGLRDGGVRFNFKLSDNMQADGDIMDFYLNGDVAPGGRFTFVY